MTDIPISDKPCHVCGCSPAWAFPAGPRCVEHYGEPPDPKIVNLLKGPAGLLNIGTGEVQGTRERPEPAGPIKPKRNHPEAAWQKQVIGLLRLHRFKVAHFGQGMMRVKGKLQWVTPAGADGKGFPDVVAIKDCIHARTILAQVWGIAWELKVKGNKATPEQLEWLRLFEMAGFFTGVYYPEDWDEIVKLLESWQ